MIVNDLNLLLACEQGNSSGQKLVFEKYSGKIMGICQRYFHSKKAEEIVHQTFLDAFENLKNNKKTDFNLFLFLRGLAIEKILSEISLYQFDSYESEFEENNFEGEFKLGVDVKRLCEIIQELDTTKRFIFNLYVIEGFSFAQISNLLHMKEEDISRIYKIAKKEVAEKTVELVS